MAKFISLFSGVGGFDLGMGKAHECVAQVEWDKNAAGVLKHRWPNVPLFCDVSKVSADDLPDADFITYGFPCQDLSVAGKREGLDGKRSGLFFEATRLIRELVARGSGLRFALAENVAGLFSADDGLALARCIRELLESGACEVGWRILNSEHFGVPQRRRRVFIVSDFGGESCDEILAITESLQGHPAPSREAGKGTAGDAGAGFTASSFGGYEKGCGTPRSQGGDLGGGSETLAVNGVFSDGEGGRGYRMTAFGKYEDDDTASCMKSRDYKDATDLIAQGADVYNGQLTGETSATVTSATGIANASGPKVIEGPCYENHPGDGRITDAGETCPTIIKRCGTGGGNLPLVKEEKNLTVRRLTPIECERLQGFPDNWTSEKMELILEGNEWKATGKIVKQADGPRYKQMGNAVTVNVAEWIGKQIGKVI